MSAPAESAIDKIERREAAALELSPAEREDRDTDTLLLFMAGATLEGKGAEADQLRTAIRTRRQELRHRRRSSLAPVARPSISRPRPRQRRCASARRRGSRRSGSGGQRGDPDGSGDSDPDGEHLTRRAVRETAGGLR